MGIFKEDIQDLRDTLIGVSCLNTVNLEENLVTNTTIDIKL